ncbi:MAG: hypothetical protein KBS57_03995 [Alistipes sp.]|nr:hypothetical protein [Candidatus Minthomonas equi]
MRKKFYICLTAILAALSPVCGQELVSNTLSKDTVLIGDHIVWKAQFNVPRDLSVDFDSLANPVVPGVEVIRHFTIDTLSLKKKFAEIEASAVLTSFDSGAYMLPDRVFYFYRGDEEVDTLHVDGKAVVVETIAVDTATFMSPEREEGDESPRFADIKPQFGYPVTFWEVAKWVLAALALAALAVAVTVIIRRKKAGLTFMGHTVVQDPPHIVALRTLDKIREEELWQKNRQKQFYTEVTDALRLYIESRFDVTAIEATSAEMLADLKKKDVSAGEFAELEELFTRSDLVKFAKLNCSREENEAAIPVAVRFVNQTYERQLNAETVNEGGEK